MAETAYTMEPDCETTEEKSSSAFPEIAIGIDIGTSECSVAVWNGSQVELLKNTRNELLICSDVPLNDDIPSVGTLDMGGRPFIAALVNNVWKSTTPEEVLALYLVELRIMAESKLKWPQQQQQQQQHMIHHNMDRGSKKVALIFNMGAGYCDVAVTATAGGVSQIKALAGSATGGEDFLQNMMCHLLLNFDSLFSSHEINEISSMCREEFEEVNQKIFEKCESLIIQCLHDAKVEVDDLTDVIVMGGCSYIPKIKNIVKSVCKRELYKGMNPLEAAVCGTALQGAVASGISDPLGDLDPLTIQTTPIGIQTNRNPFVSIIPRNITIPVHKELIVTTENDNQKEVLIVIYEGDAEKTEGNNLLGYFKIARIPPAPKGVPQIKVSMDINASNVLSLFAGLIMPGSQQPVVPIMEVRMPTVDDCYSCCAEALHREYLSTLNFI
ncbi:hypothetical protein Goshw_014975 [Gossypium schwendimanii]|uniref:Heat shock protein 70 n=1 Tax=Gossypium schwendimanii TaxID=34291 RepID=A0A7J9LG50_GOSSC|nr:hypothetical protein [Gossypium schwendimanii]